MRIARRLNALLAGLLACICFAAVAAAPAQAEGNWLIEGKTASSADLTGKQDSELYAFLIPSLNFQLVFKKFTFESGELLSSGESLMKFSFEEGLVYTITNKKLVPCEVGNLKFFVRGSLFLHEGETYELLKPAEGSVLTLTTYGGESCPLGSENPVVGTPVFEEPGGALDKEGLSHLLLPASVSLFKGAAMTFGGHPMTLDGSFSLSLTGKEAGRKWSGVG